MKNHQLSSTWRQEKRKTTKKFLRRSSSFKVSPMKSSPTSILKYFRWSQLTIKSRSATSRLTTMKSHHPHLQVTLQIHFTWMLKFFNRIVNMDILRLVYFPFDADITDKNWRFRNIYAAKVDPISVDHSTWKVGGGAARVSSSGLRFLGLDDGHIQDAVTISFW